MKNILLLLLTSFCLSSVAQTTGTKSIQLKNGQRINVLVTNNAETDMGMGMQVKNETENSSVLTVTNTNGQEYMLTNTINRLKVSFEGMGQSQEYDSDKESDRNSEMGKSLSQVVGKPVEVRINKFTGAPIQGKDDNEKEKLAGNPLDEMMSAFGAEEPTIAGAFIVIPAGKKVGDTWIEVDSSAEKKGTKTYTLKKLTGNIAEITFASDLTTNTSVDANGNSMSIQMTIKSKGDLTADVVTGLVSRRNALSEIAGTIDIQGQSLPITATSNLTGVYTLLKD